MTHEHIRTWVEVWTSLWTIGAAVWVLGWDARQKKWWRVAGMAVPLSLILPFCVLTLTHSAVRYGDLRQPERMAHLGDFIVFIYIAALFLVPAVRKRKWLS